MFDYLYEELDFVLLDFSMRNELYILCVSFFVI